jgi:CheY-like chemotaxis protein
MLLLFVDDDSDQHFLYEMYSKTLHGVRIARAENGAEGFALVQSFLPDIIISDFDMPLMNGYSFWQLLRADDKTRNIPFVLVSSYITPRGLFRSHHDAFEEIRRDAHAQLHSKEHFQSDTLADIVRSVVEGNVAHEVVLTEK